MSSASSMRFRNSASRRTPLGHARPRRRNAPRLELLEGRLVLSAYTVGDVFAAVGDGQVKELNPTTGAVVQTLSDTVDSTYNAGMAFTSAGNLLVTDFGGQAVSQFDNNGNFVGKFGSGYNSDPESIALDSSGNVYVGQADGSHQILKFNSSGTLLATYSPATEDRGTDWIDLAADQKTMYYTSEGKFVHRFDVSTSTQLANLNTTPLSGDAAYALRVIPAGPFAGDVLVADSDQVVRLDTSGNIAQTYLTAQGPSTLFALNLDPDGKSFWTADLSDGNVYKVDIATGAIDKQFTVSANTALAGLAVFGEIRAATGTDNLGLLSLDPTGKDALTVSGNGKVAVNSGAVVVNSNNTEAAVVADNGIVTASDIDITGGHSTKGNGSFTGAPIDNETPAPDPIGTPLPPAPAPTFSAVNDNSFATRTLSPGTYVGGIHAGFAANIVLSPGVYYLEGGGLQVTNSATITGTGVLIVNAPAGPNDSISVSGNASVTLTAPSPGSLPSGYSAYQGITIMQDPASALAITISGNGVLTMDGAFYAPKATLHVGGNGVLTDTTDSTTPVAEVIVADADVTDNGVLTINAGPAGASAATAAVSSSTVAVNDFMSDEEVLNEVAMSLSLLDSTNQKQS